MNLPAHDLARTEPDLAALDLVDGVTAPDDAVGVELMLGDLMQDEGGEVVLYNDSGLRAVALLADAPVTAEGEADPHVTASGADVTGFRFVSFSNGLTLYYQDGLDLVIKAP